ncbi:MAG: glycosyltransferase family A protein [Cyanobacteria bacterium]|nr:glycosyltransferase family A protein [Cyanobacteriota bacterium]MDA0866507.1 glycosyltransferase family A protein [Cyanobacteriota bacterium]
MNSPLVSIIIPAYNASSLISEALDSVARQTYPKWEVIVVEDGTKDGTEGILKEFSSHFDDERVHYIHHLENKGVSATRNTAMAASNGEYIAFLDHDDTWDDCHIDSLMNYLESESKDLVFSIARSIKFDRSKDLGMQGPSRKEWENFPSSLLDYCYIPVSSVVLRKTVYEKIGGFDVRLSKAEDLDYWIRCIDNNISFGFFSKPTNTYRQGSPTSATSNKEDLLIGHAQVLRKHHRKKITPHRYIQGAILARHHLGVARRNLKKDLLKSTQFFLYSWRLSPLGSLLAIHWFLAEKLGFVEKNSPRHG